MRSAVTPPTGWGTAPCEPKVPPSLVWAGPWWNPAQSNHTTPGLTRDTPHSTRLIRAGSNITLITLARRHIVTNLGVLHLRRRAWVSQHWFIHIKLNKAVVMVHSINTQHCKHACGNQLVHATQLLDATAVLLPAVALGQQAGSVSTMH